jgi:cobalt transporter subunit CbtB
MFQTLNEYSHQTIGVTLNAVAQVLVVLAVVAFVAWAILFTEYPALHDFFHQLRHSLYVIPCH